VYYILIVIDTGNYFSLSEEPDFCGKESKNGSAQHRSAYYGDVFLLLK